LFPQTLSFSFVELSFSLAFAWSRLLLWAF